MTLKDMISIYDPNYHYSCGYHDLSPFSPDEKHLIFCSIDKNDFKKNKVLGKKDIEVDIKIMNLKNKKISNLISSRAYSLEQGVRINWIDNQRISINNIDNNLIPQFIIFNIYNMKVEKVIKDFFAHQLFGIGKKICLSMDYSQIRRNWPSYGYTHSYTDLQTKNSLNIIDWGEKKLIKRINLDELDSYKKYNEGFIVHPTMSENGERLLFMHRLNFNNILYSWLYFADLKTGHIKLITEEKVSHFTWIGNDKFLLYRRILPKFIKENRIKKYMKNCTKKQIKRFDDHSNNNFNIINKIKKILGRFTSGFVIYNIDHNNLNKKIIALNLLGIDCHPFYSKANHTIYLDSYPNNNGDVKIYALKIAENLFAKIQKNIPGNWKTNIGKVDAHLRISNKGNFVCIDEVLQKRRSIRVMKICSN